MTHDLQTAGIDRRFGPVAALAGLALALVVQVAAPVGVPLYDGVVVQEPYRYLQPVGSQPGAPTSFTSSPVVRGIVSPPFVAATTESPPQAQMIAQADAFQLTAGATSLQVAITPVEPPSVSSDGPILGNVYRISVTDQSGTPLAIKPCEGCLNLVMRAPEGVDVAHLAVFAGGRWTSIATVHAGMVAMYATRPETLGDFAIVTGNLSVGGAEPLDFGQIIVFGGATVILVLAFTAALLFRRGGVAQPARRATAGTSPSGRRSRGIPSKRKVPRTTPRTPPSGRTEE